MAQYPEILLDFFLYFVIPQNFFSWSLKTPQQYLYDLNFKLDVIKNYGLFAYSNFDLNNFALPNILLNHYNYSSFTDTFKKTTSFRFIEQRLFHLFRIKKYYSYDIETLEYHDTSTAPFENSINAWFSLFVDRFSFLELVYNPVLIRFVDRAWTNYSHYIELHISEELF